MKNMHTLPIIIGNWKLNGSKLSIYKFIEYLKSKSIFSQYNKKLSVILSLPNLYLYYAKNILSKTPLNQIIQLSSQNVDTHISGAYTGEISVNMLSDIGIKYTILGHSERRKYHYENNDAIATKFILSKNEGITPILCIGENKLEKDSGNTKKVLLHQINSIFNKNTSIHDMFNNSIIAYEPLWSIGSGCPASPKEVKEIHKLIRNFILKKQNYKLRNLYILYGGSVTEKNAFSFFKEEDIDGCLIGNASLNPKEFYNIIKYSFSKQL